MLDACLRDGILDLTQGHAVAFALEEAEGAGNVKQRRLAYVFEAISPPITAGETVS